MRAGDKMGMVSWLGVSWSWGEVLINLLKEHELKFNVTAINSKHRSCPLARFINILIIHTEGVGDHFHSKYVKMYGEWGHFLKARMNWVVGLKTF